MSNTSTTHFTSDYKDAYQSFDLQVLKREIFNGQFNDSLNAYLACCGRHASKTPNKIALIHEDTKGHITQKTFSDLVYDSGKVANLLKQHGIQAGDRVATMLPRTPELLTIVLATWRIGAVYQPLFTAFGCESIEYRLNKANTKIVFTNAENRQKFTELTTLPKMFFVGKNPDDNVFQDDDYYHAIKELSSDCPATLLEESSPFLQMFTSGTVGKSKGVSVPLSALPAFYIYMKYAIDLKDTDRYWNMADPGWAYGLYYGITAPLLMGITTYFNESSFSAQNTLNFLIRHKITNLASSPTAFRMMKSSDIFNGQKDNLSLRCANSAGETLNTEVVSWVKSHLGCSICDQYGQTETGMTCCEHHALNHTCPVGSMGLAMLGHKLVVLDENMQELGDGQQGQLAVVVSESPAFYFKGYSWNEKEAFHGDYYLTGDIVERHSDGTYWFSGRDDDIIITAGYRVGPTDVENTVMEHEAVAESAAVGIPDDVRGYVIKSFVVLKSGFNPSDEIAEQIKQLVHERLSAHAYPRYIEFVTSLPKTPSGKIQRFMLRNRH